MERSQVDLDALTRSLASDVVSAVRREVSEPLEAAGGGWKCDGVEFTCDTKYDCNAPDSCEPALFTCSQTYNPPKPKPKPR